MKRSLSPVALSACVAAAAFAFAAAPAGAQQQNSNQPSGEARIVQRQGPTIEVERQQRPIAAVVFTKAGDTGLEVDVLDSDPKNANADKEAIFDSKDAQKGIVTNDFGQTDGTRRLIITARRQGMPVQVQEAGSNGMARIFVVRHEQPKPQNVAQDQQKQQQQQAQAHPQQPQQAQQAAAGSPGAQSGGNAAGNNAQPAAAKEQPQQAQQQAQQPQERQAAPEQNDAVIFLYLCGRPQ